MRIQLVADFGGRETGERHYPPGSVLEVDDVLGERLIKDHRAVLLEESPSEAPVIVPAPAAPVKRPRPHGR